MLAKHSVLAGRQQVVVRRAGSIALPLVLTLLFVVHTYLTQSVRLSAPDHGDYWYEMYTVVAARNLSRYGFSPLRFGVTADNGPEIGLPPIYLTHHPSFPAVALGVLDRLGLSIPQARILPLLVSCSALLGVFLLISRMFNDRRAGIVGLLAMGAAAPFRLLSDSFTYSSYDFAAKTWTLLFITLGALTVGRRRTAWFAAAGLGAFATMALSGFEMVPAILVYSVLFPLFLAPCDRPGRLRVTLMSGLATWAGLLAGFATRILHNAWLLGGVPQVAADFAAAFDKRAALQVPYFGRQYHEELAHRLQAYYPEHLIVILLGILAALLLAAAGRKRPSGGALAWLGLVFCGEALWFVILRQHAHEHAHTTAHVLLSMTIATTMAASSIWTAVRGSERLRAATLLIGAGLLAASVAGLGVEGHGNLQVRLDLSRRQAQVEALASTLPGDAVVLMGLPGIWFDMEPVEPFFLGRTFVRERAPLRPPGSVRPWFLFTLRKEDDPLYASALVKNRLLATTDDYALFDLRPAAR